MIRKFLLGVAVFFCATGIHAQSAIDSGVPAGVDERSIDVLVPSNESERLDSFFSDLEAMEKRAGVTEETVGDPYSFERNKTYLGVAQTASVVLQADCSGYPPDAGRCIETNPAPDVTFVDEPDLAVIELPGKSTKTILCFTFTPFASWQWYNDTGSEQTARMFLRPAVRIESDVLNDPTLIDPGTGLPFNGVLLDSTVSTFLQARTLDPGESDFQFNATTRSCTGGLVSVRALRDGYGLSDAVIKNFFKNPITISFGVRGNVSMVTDASYFVGVRLYGD